MTNSTKTILNKSLSELRKKQTLLSKEIENIAIAISSIENVIVPEQAINVKSKVFTNNLYKRRAPLSENQVRDAVIEIAKNTKAYGVRSVSQGYFTSGSVMKYLDHSFSGTISKYLNIFESRGMLESKKFRTGKQYKYIPPTVTGPGKEFEQSKAITPPANISASALIPGTGKNGLTLRNKDIEKLVNKAVSEGFTAERLGSDYLRIISKSGKVATISTTGTDKAMYVENCRSDLKRIGVQV